MKIGALYSLGIALILILAAALRFPHLADRPMHGDEAVHAVKFLDLWETGHYAYDPFEFHGPTLNYLTLVPVWLLGLPNRAALTEFHLRLVPAVAGLLTIALLPLLRRGLGTIATLTAALLLAVSPAFVFYNDDYIQESLLASFTLAAIACGWRYLESRRLIWAALCGLSLGLMHATKETSLISFASIAGAQLAVRFIIRTRHASGGVRPNRPRLAPALLLAALVAVATSAAFYSSFGRNPRGILDSVAMITRYAPRAAGAELHVAPWWYFLKLLTWTHYPPAPIFSQAFILLLAIIGLGGAARLRLRQTHPAGESPPETSQRLAIFIAAFALLSLLAYSVIPYKTPWCILQSLLGLILLAGCGAEAAHAAARANLSLLALLAVTLLAASANLAHQSQLALGRWSTDNRNPYVYAQPVRDVAQVPHWLEQIATIAPERFQSRINVFHPNSWPLPWYLRNFTAVGYWEEVPPAPAVLDAPIIIADSQYAETLSSRLTGEYQVSNYGLRPAEDLLVYVRSDLYQRFRDALAPPVPESRP